jgi:hypothetical protein
MSMEGSNNSLSLPFITKVMDQHLVSDTRSCCICFGLAGNGIIVYLQSISNCKSLKSTGERTTDGLWVQVHYLHEFGSVVNSGEVAAMWWPMSRFV